MTQKWQKATQSSSILPSVLSICELAEEPVDSLHALHANHGAQVSVSRTHPQGMVGRPHGQHCNIGTLGLEPRVLPVSYGPGFFLLGEPLPWSARDPSRLVLLNCVVVCHLATPTCRCAVHGFETAVGRDLLAVGEPGHCRH